ncbi:MAG: hypothetical protein AAGJ46_12475 [Planctomycetota bacterium]
MSDPISFEPPSRWGLRFLSFERSSRRWLVLHEVAGEKRFVAWSGMVNSKVGSAAVLADRIAAHGESIEIEDDLTNVFLTVADEYQWDFWGSGIPMPIDGYYDAVLSQWG